MSRIPEDLAKKRVVSSLLLAFFLLSVVWIVEWQVSFPKAGEALKGHLTEVKGKQLDLVVDMAKIFINWGFGIIAANGFILKFAVESKSRLQAWELAAIEASIASALISTLYGQRVLTNVVMLLQLDQFNAANPLVDQYMGRQFWALVIAVLAMLGFAHSFFWRMGHESER